MQNFPKLAVPDVATINRTPLIMIHCHGLKMCTDPLSSFPGALATLTAKAFSWYGLESTFGVFMDGLLLMVRIMLYLMRYH